MALTAPVLPLVGDVRVVSTGLNSTQGEVLPWVTGATTVTPYRTASAGTPIAATVAAGVGQATIPAALLSEPGVVQLLWESDGQSFWTTLDVRAGRLPVHAVTQSLSDGSTTAASDHAAWKVARATGDALIEMEQECRVALMPRRSQERVSGGGFGGIRFLTPYVHAIVECSDETVSLVDVDFLNGAAHLASGGFSGRADFVIDHGEETLAPDVARAVALLASSRLADGPADDRGFLLQTGDGMVQRLTAGVRGARFSIPDVEAAYRRHRLLLVR